MVGEREGMPISTCGGRAARAAEEVWRREKAVGPLRRSGGALGAPAAAAALAAKGRRRLFGCCWSGG
jgi:hypothetical protein